MKKWWIIVIILIILSIAMFYYLYYKPKKCIDSNEMCKGKVDGSVCNTGVWCDNFGRICGGDGCVGFGKGKCVNERCEPLGEQTP